MPRRHHLLSLRTLIHLLVLRPLLKLLFGVSIEGRENLCGLDRFILVANHNSHLDVLLLFHSLTARQLQHTHAVAAYEYFRKPRALFWLVSFLFDPVWVVRGERQRDPLREFRDLLQRGHSLVLFPEGTRGEAGEVARFKSGVGQLAVEFRDIPIVPVYLMGPDRSFPKKSPFPIPLCNRLLVAPPLLFAGSRKEITAALESTILDMAASQAVARHRRATRPREIAAVAVVGIDGSGKSTLARRLAERLSQHGRVCLITDDIAFYEHGMPVKVQLLLKERLRETIGRKAKTAGSLKSYKIPKLAELLLRDRIVKDVRRWYAPDLIVMDGAPLLNITAWARLYREEAFDEPLCASVLRTLSGADDGGGGPLYEQIPELVALKRLHLTNLELPDATLFVDVDPAVSMHRIRSRGQSQQVHETEEKEGYQLVCQVVDRDLEAQARTLDGHRQIGELVDAAVAELDRLAIARFPPRVDDGRRELACD